MYIINPPKRQQCRWPQEQPELWLSSESSLCLTSLFLFMSVWFFLVSLVLPTVPRHRQLWIHILEFTISWIQAILVPACASSSPAFLMRYSEYKLNKQHDNIEPRHTPFLIWIQSIISCPVLTVASWPAHRFLRRQVKWSGIPISLRIFHSVLWSTQSKAWPSQQRKSRCFSGTLSLFHDPTDIGNLISDSSAFSKSSLNIWKFTVHVLLNRGMENFEHYFASMWDECNCAAVWAFFGIDFLLDCNENWRFPVLWPLLSFPNSHCSWKLYCIHCGGCWPTTSAAPHHGEKNIGEKYPPISRHMQFRAFVYCFL